VQGVEAHPQKFWIVEKLGKTTENMGKIPENPGKNGAQCCFTSKNGAQRLQKSTIKILFWRSHQKQVFMFFVGEKLWAKSPQ